MPFDVDVRLRKRRCRDDDPAYPWTFRAVNGPLWLARLLRLGGVLETVTGLALIADPAGGASALFGSSMEGPAIAIGRIGGGALLSLGIACWLARKTPTAPASVGVAWGYLAYNLVTCATLAWASVALSVGSLPTLGGLVLHGLLGAALLAALLGRAPPGADS